MPIEAERKFLVMKEVWDSVRPRKGSSICQGYLSRNRLSCRIRIADDSAYLTLKQNTESFSRFEYEVPIDYSVAKYLIDNFAIGSIIEKTRFTVPHGGLVWTVDVFERCRVGLLLAEVEVREDQELDPLDLPPWVGLEVTGKPEYYNSNM